MVLGVLSQRGENVTTEAVQALPTGTRVCVFPMDNRGELSGRVYSTKRLGAFIEIGSRWGESTREFFLASEIRNTNRKDTTT